MLSSVIRLIRDIFVLDSVALVNCLILCIIALVEVGGEWLFCAIDIFIFLKYKFNVLVFV